MKKLTKKDKPLKEVLLKKLMKKDKLMEVDKLTMELMREDELSGGGGIPGCLLQLPYNCPDIDGGEVGK